MLDNSGSLHTSGFANVIKTTGTFVRHTLRDIPFQEKTFVNGIFNYFNFDSTEGRNRSRVALMDFGDTTELMWDLSRYENDPNAAASLTKALMTVPYKAAAVTNTFRYTCKVW